MRDEELIALDVAVSEAVFDRKWVKHPAVCINGCWHNVETWLEEDDDPGYPAVGTKVGQTPPPWSTHMEYAWRIVFWMRMKGFSFRLTEVPSWSSVQSGSVAGFAKGVYPPSDDWDGIWGRGQDAPEAICRAAVSAMTLVQQEEVR